MATGAVVGRGALASIHASLSPVRMRNLRTLGLILSVLCYLLTGAAVFDALESESARATQNALEERLHTLKERLALTEHDYREVERVALLSAPHRAGRQWKFTGSFYFAITVISTIGGSHFVAEKNSETSGFKGKFVSPPPPNTHDISWQNR